MVAKRPHKENDPVVRLNAELLADLTSIKSSGSKSVSSRMWGTNVPPYFAWSSVEATVMASAPSIKDSQYCVQYSP